MQTIRDSECHIFLFFKCDLDSEECLLNLQVRRGRHQAEIYSIALSPNLKWLAVCSDKGTLHVFSLRVRDGKKDAGGKQSAAAGSVMKTNTASNARSSLSFMKGDKILLRIIPLVFFPFR